MRAEHEQSLINHIVAALPRELLVSVDENLRAAAKSAFLETVGRDAGHRSSALGQARHFCSNEALATTFDAFDVQRTPIKGTSIVVGTIGSMYLSRFSTNHPKWTSKHKSKRRLELVRENRWVEELMQPSILDDECASADRLALFFVSVFFGIAEVPTSVDIVVPDVTLRHSIFTQSISQFLEHYSEPVVQIDAAKVSLKVPVSERKTSDGQK